MRLVSRLLLSVVTFYCISARAQTAHESNIHIKVINEAREPLAFATVVIVNVPDTVHKQQLLTDSNGVVIARLIPMRPYIFRISSINYQPIEKNITIKSENASYTFTAKRSEQKLSDVVVTAKKPLMRQEDDKTIVEPENLALASTNAYEIMEKVPGLFIDQDGNIFLSSTTAAKVYINGREQKMSTADIATLLKSLPPNSIASIEIIRTPSAKYDASTSGGIVNVVLKKGVKIGLVGSVNAGMNQGVYGNQFAGVNFNNSNGGNTQYLSVQLSKRNTYEEIKTDRFFTPDSILRQDAFTKYPTNSFYLGYGLGYDLKKRWEFNYDGRFSYNQNNTTGYNTSQILPVTTEQVVSNNRADTKNEINSFYVVQSITLRKKLDSLGSEWSTDLSANFSPNNTDQNILSVYLFPPYPPTAANGKIKNSSNYFTLQSDLTKKYSNGLTVEAGIKSSWLRFHNTTDYFFVTDSTRVKDQVRTGAYIYDENINAAFLQGSKNFSGFLLKLGTRLENTNMDGKQEAPSDTSFTIHRTDLFPYVYLSHSVMKIFGYELRAYLVYRRTINRPTYDYLNPAIRIVDPYLFETGNPSLRPQFNNNYEANISVEERPIIAIGINDTKDIFNQVVYEADSNQRITYRTWDNLGKNHEFYLRGFGAIPPGKRYFFVLGGQYNHNFYQGQYENAPLDYKRGSWTFFTYHSFKLTPLTVLTLNGFIRLNGQFQFYELTPFGSLNFSASQQFLKKKLVVSASIVDMFYTNNNDFTINQGSVHASGSRNADTRRFGLNLRYNFGIRKKEENNMPTDEIPER